MAHEGLADEMHVGGVYLRLYMRNPQYPLRHPKTFLEVGSLPAASHTGHFPAIGLGKLMQPLQPSHVPGPTEAAIPEGLSDIQRLL